MVVLECRWLELQTYSLGQAEEQVHVMHCRSACSLEQVVNNRCYEQLVAMLLKVYETFVGIHHLFQVNGALHHMCERVTLIIGSVEIIQSLDIKVTLHDKCSEDATWEASTIGNKVNAAVKIGLQLLYALHDLGHVLVLEWLVYAYIVVSPTVVGCCRWLHAGTSAAGYCVHRDIALEQVLLGKRQQTKLYAGCKTTGVCHITALACITAVKLGQAVYKIVTVALKAIVH